MDPQSRREAALYTGLAALVLLALISGSGALWILVLLVGTTAGLVWLWGRFALVRLEYRRAFSQNRCFAGEEVELTVSITNRKVLPVTYLAVDDQVPDELVLKSRQLRFLRLGKGTLRLLFGLAWYQQVIRHYRVTATRRGFYRLGPAVISGGDPFGYTQRSEVIEEPITLIVYPRVVDLERVGIPARRPFGDLRSGSRLFEDPLLFAGLREYRPGDPLNRVHWKASAASGRLQVRLLDPSSNPGLAVFLNTWSYDQPWMGTDTLSFEAGCVIAASVVSWAAEQGIPVGLFANGMVHEWGLNLRIEPTREADLLSHTLEGLARLQPISREPLADLIVDETSRLSYGTSVVVITRYLPDDLAGTVVDIHRSGRPVTLIFTGAELPALPRLKSLRVYHVPGEEALHANTLA